MGTLEELYRQHVAAVFRFAKSVVGRQDVAEDLTSEAFLALSRNLDAVDQSQLPAWLLTVVKNRARDLWRHEVVERRFAETSAAVTTSEEPALGQWILECGDLKPVHRTCLMLRYAYGMSRAEIAAAIGLSETQVKGHLQYALSLLRKVHARSDRT